MMTRQILLLFLLVAVPVFAIEQETASKKEIPHYCDDFGKWAGWVKLIEKYPHDDDLRAVFALRIGLCEEIKNGTIETDRAITIFNRFFEALKSQAAIDSMKQEKLNPKKQL